MVVVVAAAAAVDCRQMFVRILSSEAMPMVLPFSTLACYMKFVIFLTEME